MLAEALIQAAAVTPDPSRKRLLYTQAMASAERLRKMQPDDPEAISLLGRAALGAGRYAAAEGAFRAALSSRPGSCSTLVNLSRALVAQEKIGEARAALESAARCAPAMPEVHEDLGHVYFRLERFDLALEAFRRADEIQPSPGARAAIEAVRVKLDGRGAGPAPRR
jgi:cytochrome c-type biogenesis protein CcmH/NrfG